MTDIVESFVATDYAKVGAAVSLTTHHPELTDEHVRRALVSVLDEDRDYASIAARVAVIAAREVRQEVQRRATERRIAGAPIEPEPTAGYPRVDELLQSAIESLPERQRQIALLYFYLGAGIAEIADATHLNESTVVAHVDASRRSIVDHIVGDGPGVGS
ncbi:MAG: hypothetical protein KDB69_02545 [Acidimicrobiia bacterium]|nr:hypothetical protein [Acidimicrobiia bacterium]